MPAFSTGSVYVLPTDSNIPSNRQQTTTTRSVAQQGSTYASLIARMQAQNFVPTDWEVPSGLVNWEVEMPVKKVSYKSDEEKYSYDEIIAKGKSVHKVS